MGTLFPQKLLTTVRSQHTFQSTASLTTLDTTYSRYYDVIFGMKDNSEWDPLDTSGSVQPQWHDTFASLYDRTLVKWCKFTLQISNMDTNNDYQLCLWTPHGGNNIISTWDQLEAQPYCTKKYLRVSGNNGDKVWIKGFIRPQKFYPLTPFQNQYSVITSDPTIVIWSYLYAMNMTNADTTCNIMVKATMIQRVLYANANVVPDP